MNKFALRKTGERRRERIASLLKLDEASLYRGLGDPRHFGMDLPMFALGAVPRRTAALIQWERRQRIEDHSRTARDLRRCAGRTVDAEQRAEFERSAQMNEAIAATLEAMPPELEIQEPTAAERRRACKSAIAEAEPRHLTLKARQLVSPAAEHAEELEHLAKYLHDLTEELKELSREEAAAEERSRAEWDALEEARRMVAEADGRAQFNELVPDIRTRLCMQWHACEQVKKYEDETALTTAVADVLMALSTTLPIVTVAVLVVKIGVKKFCNCPT